jgi:Domain of unknown function (DUF4115)
VAGRHRRVRSSASARHRKPPRRGHIVLPTLAAAAILGAGGVGASAALSGGGSADHPAATRPAGPIATLAPSTTPTGGATPTVAPAPRPAPVPDFAITVTGRVSWVQVIGPHGRVLIAAIVRHGRTLTYSQRPLVVTLGDAGAVRLVVHHHVKAPAGRRGAVLRLTVR